mmetsp:Transcript_12888/g.26342  ORF Transcript_12888/g.26342 Transcript_12888/m.26342 type:complete len:80 (-) Transcript_12888:1736-1975(-)
MEAVAEEAVVAMTDGGAGAKGRVLETGIAIGKVVGGDHEVEIGGGEVIRLIRLVATSVGAPAPLSAKKPNVLRKDAWKK